MSAWNPDLRKILSDSLALEYFRPQLVLDVERLAPKVVTIGVAAPHDVAVISYLFWKKHFAQAPDVLGKPLDLNHHRYIVIGVVGPRFTWGDGEV